MGRILDLFTEVAAAAEEGGEGLVLSLEEQERLRDEWEEEDLEDALKLVQETLLQGELVDSADSLSARLVELLGAFGEAAAFEKARTGHAVLTLDAIGQLTRRVAHLEEAIAPFREGAPPDRKGFDALQGRLMDVGIETEMWGDRPESSPAHEPGSDEEE